MAQFKLLQFKYENNKQIDGYFVIKTIGQVYYSGTGKHAARGLVDFKETFVMPLPSFIDVELWDYWTPVILGSIRLDVQKMHQERKNMHFIRIMDKGDLVIQLIFDEEYGSQKPSFVSSSSQGSSFYDNHSLQRNTQYKPWTQK